MSTTPASGTAFTITSGGAAFGHPPLTRQGVRAGATQAPDQASTPAGQAAGLTQVPLQQANAPVVAAPPAAPAAASSATVKVQGAKDMWDSTVAVAYPADIQTTKKFFRMGFGAYVKSAIDDPAQLIDTSSIVLPLPTNLADGTKIAWEDVELGVFGGEFYEPIINFGRSAVDELTAGNLPWNSAKKLVGEMGDKITAPGAKEALLRRGASAFSAAAATVLDQVSGSTANPHIAAGFKGVPLRSHTFAWKLAPETEQESKDLHKIISMIRARSSPNKIGDGKTAFMLSYPDICRPSIVLNGGLYQDLFPMKPSVITDIQINYAGGGVPSFFKNTAAPTVINLQITFKELTIMTRSDHEEWYKKTG